MAVVTVDGLAEINQLCGYDVGDSLLGALGRVLAERVSVDLTAGRIGGSHLALLQTPAPSRHPTDLVGPIVDDLDAALRRWLDDRAALGTPCPIMPRARVGVAAGHGGATWSDAETALAVAQSDPNGAPIVSFDLGDPRLASHRRRQLLADDLAEALHHRRLPVDRRPVTPIDEMGPGWVRLLARPDLARPAPTGPTDTQAVLATDLGLAPGLAGQVDRHLLERAIERPEPADGASTPVSLVVLGPLEGPRSVLFDESPTTSVELGIEITQDALAAADPAALGRRLHELGWGLAIDGFDGGWADWTAVDRLPVHHLRPSTDLVGLALADRSHPASHLRALTANAADRGIPVAADDRLLAEPSAVERLLDLGITHLERRSC